MFTIVGRFNGLEFILAALALIITLIVSLSAHEFAHAYAAHLNGDDTAKHQGRLTLNPKAHLDPIGFIACAFFGFGWAKPVPVNPMRFRKYKKGMAWVAVAGVLVNLALAFIFGGIFTVLNLYAPITNNLLFFAHRLSEYMLMINTCLFVFNLLPVYPLDGFNLVSTFLPYDNKYTLFMRQYGPLVLMGCLLFLSGMLTMLIYSVIKPILLFWSLLL